MNSLLAKRRERLPDERTREVNGAAYKGCLDCHQVKPLTDFYIDRAKGDGRGAYCKPCMIERGRSNPGTPKAAGSYGYLEGYDFERAEKVPLTYRVRFQGRDVGRAVRGSDVSEELFGRWPAFGQHGEAQGIHRTRADAARFLVAALRGDPE